MASLHDESGGLIGQRAFVRTYAHPSYPDPWDAIEDYERVMEFQRRNPEMGSGAASTRLDLPRGRIRKWMNGSRPDCLRGLEDAQSRGWIGVNPDSDTFRGLNVLQAWTLSGGSISSDGFNPRWNVRDRTQVPLLKRAAGLAGLDVELSRGHEAGRAMELRPVEDAAVLGRVLYVLGAPKGTKNTDGPSRLPRYLSDVSTEFRKEFVQVYLHNRGHRRESREIIQFRDRRSAAYLQAVADLTESLTGADVEVDDRHVVLSSEAVAAVDQWNPLLGM